MIVIEAGKTEKHYWKDILAYRELFLFLSWRDILVRYKQTVIGIAWSIIRPVLTMIVFSFIFGRLAKLPSQGIPYPILVYAAMLPWQLFANSFSDSSNSLIGNRNLLSKVYFPRMIIPASSVIVNLVDFLISFGVLCVLMTWYRFVPDVKIVLLPLFLLLAMITAFGSGLLIASLNVKFRDFKYIVPFMIQFGLYISPVGFLTSVIPEKYRLLYYINPLVGVIDGFRWAILGGENILYFKGFYISVGVSLLLLCLGIVYFRKTERYFADFI